MSDNQTSASARTRDQVLADVRKTSGAAYFATATWLATAGKEPGNEQHLSTQIGCQIEEFAEYLRAVYIESNTGITTNALQELAAHLDACAHSLKKGLAQAKIYDREAALDALCDIEVTGNGVAFLAGMNKPAADVRVIASNWAKFDADGKPVILDGGKVGKAEGWAPPEFSDLV